MWTLLIIWDTGEKEYHKYLSEEKAREAENGFLMGFGKQVAYSSVYWRWNA